MTKRPAARRRRIHEWHYEQGFQDYFASVLAGQELLPQEPFNGSLEGQEAAVDWAVQWAHEGGELLTESYVNLIPTPQGGSHVSGLRARLA